MSDLWPVTLSGATPSGLPVVLRPLRRRDREEWEALRVDNAHWLMPWEATSPDPTPPRMSFRQLVRHLDQEAHEGRLQPWAVEVDGGLVGQLHLFGLAWGSMRSAAAGYWVAESVAGQGITPTALAMACDYAFNQLGLHRVEVNIRPDNVASLRVVAKLGFRDEGIRLRYLHINGAWRDHRTFALTTEDLAGTRMVDRLNSPQQQPHQRHTERGPRQVT